MLRLLFTFRDPKFIERTDKLPGMQAVRRRTLAFFRPSAFALTKRTLETPAAHVTAFCWPHQLTVDYTTTFPMAVFCIGRTLLFLHPSFLPFSYICFKLLGGDLRNFEEKPDRRTAKRLRRLRDVGATSFPRILQQHHQTAALQLPP